MDVVLCIRLFFLLALFYLPLPLVLQALEPQALLVETVEDVKLEKIAKLEKVARLEKIARLEKVASKFHTLL